eukprot:288208-Pelagomonas_calceolata.AAC.7
MQDMVQGVLYGAGSAIWWSNMRVERRKHCNAGNRRSSLQCTGPARQSSPQHYARQVNHKDMSKAIMVTLQVTIHFLGYKEVKVADSQEFTSKLAFNA